MNRSGNTESLAGDKKGCDMRSTKDTVYNSESEIEDVRQTEEIDCVHHGALHHVHEDNNNKRYLMTYSTRSGHTQDEEHSSDREVPQTLCEW